MTRQIQPVTPVSARWLSEQEVADQIPIDVDPIIARRTLAEVGLWFHTFALNRAHRIYTPGKARDHGYRLSAIPDSFDGMRVLDIGTFDGFYAYLAEARGADRVVAIDNEQHIHWVKDRWGVELEGAEGFDAIHRLLDSDVEYRKLDAFEIGSLDEEFDFIFCFGLLHRVENPLGLLRLLTERLAEGGQILVETYGIEGDRGAGDGAIFVPEPGAVYARDNFVYWQFSSGSLNNLASFTDGVDFELHSTPIVDGHPRILGWIT